MTSKRLLFTLLFVSASTGSSGAGDRLSEARIAAIDGDHARCADIADDVRKSQAANWYAHQVYASCVALAAQKNKDELGADKYEAESLKAIAAIEEIVLNGKNLTSRQRVKFSHMAIEMRKQLSRDLVEMRKK